MKTLRILTFVLISLFVVSSTMDAQPWKDLKKKAKSKKEALTKKKKTDKKTTTTASTSSNQTNTSSTSSNTSSGTTQSTTDDEEYVEYLKKTHTYINSDAEWLGKYELKNKNIPADVHLAEIKQLDYPNVLAKLKSKGVPSGSKAKWYYDGILEYKNTYKQAFDESLSSTINEKFENAYKFKSEEAKSIKEITAAKDLIDAASIMLPDDEKAKTLKAEVDKAYESLAGPYYKKVYTSDFHKENAGKILFSNKPIVVGQEDPAQFKTKFSITERIYGIAYLKGTIKGLFDGKTTGMYKIDLAGKSDFIYFEHIPMDMDKSYYIIEILPDPAIATHADDAGNFPWRLAGLSPRTHHLEIAYADEKVAFGAIDIDCSGIDAEKIKAEGKLSKKNAADNLARFTMLPKSFGDPTKAFKDPGLSYTNMKKILMNRWENCASIIKVAAYGTDNNDWYTEKNNLGIPKGKGTTREIKAIYKGKDGWCYFVEEIGFQRIYSGGGKYSAVKFWKDGEHVRIDCKNVK